MKKIIFPFALLALFNSCSDINNKNISSLNYLPAESELILNINDLYNTKEILLKNTLSQLMEVEKTAADEH